ncbi:MAG: hypothetical protein JXB85_01265 [Anaerolineales bacterium]|nr:hypothetical protein [Anaerolineales bacterium]
MKATLEPRSSGWLLLVGPRSLNGDLLAAVARLGGRSAVRVLDGGNRFNAYRVARAARGRAEVLERVTIARAFTCYQVLSLLEGSPGGTEPFVILDLLNTFYDESVPPGERKRLLAACIPHLGRLARTAPGLVSVHPPAVPGRTASDLLDLLRGAAAEAFFARAAAPEPEPRRLF